MKKVLKHQLTNEEPKSTTKKYIKRVYETKEAEEEIVQYTIERCVNYEVETGLTPHELEERFKDDAA